MLLIGLLFSSATNAPANVEIVQTLFEVTFDENAVRHDWPAERNCRVIVRGNALRVEALQGMPQIARQVNFNGGDFRLTMEIRTRTESSVALFWTSRGSFRRDDANSVSVTLNEDGDWHSYQFDFTVPDILESLMFRFSAPDGSWEILSMSLTRRSRPPLSLQHAEPIIHDGQELLRFTVANNLLIPLRYRIGNRQTLEEPLLRGGIVNIGVPIRPEGNLAAVALTLHPEGFPSIVFPIFLYRPEGQTDWLQRSLGNDKMVEIAPDGRMARLWRGDELFGIIAPLVHRDGVIPDFVLADDSDERELRFESDEVSLRISIVSPFLNFEITDKHPAFTPPVSDSDGETAGGALAGGEADEELADGGILPAYPFGPDTGVVVAGRNPHHIPASGEHGWTPLEGPVVRLFGELQSGLLPGVEFLRPGGTSSSEIDVLRPFNDRSRPNPLWITMPLAVQETEKGGVAMYWEYARLQPTFSTPNRFDHTDDHRFSLMGSPTNSSWNVSLELLLPDNEPASFRGIKSHVTRKGFPALPTLLRTEEEQLQLYTRALSGSLQSEMGGQWGRALEPDWQRKPFADMLSTSARLTEAAGGRVRNPVAVIPGGADISNDAIFFLFGRIVEWQQHRENAIRQILATANPDGSFLFRTRFPNLETAASSFGYTAMQALEVMEYARITGNDELFAVVVHALAFLERCDVPRGGYYMDTPFHTPDLQAAASLVWLYTWAYEYSGDAHYLERAAHFAYAGLPFIYQVSQREHMLYGAVGKFGGTHRRLPLHFGVLSTRVAIQYAYALNLLSQHDHRADWKMVAMGILHAMENLQYTEGVAAGCLPEFFDVIVQEPSGWTLNPCALVSLRWAVENRVDSLFVLMEGRDRYTAPYPLRSTSAGVEAYNVPLGQRFHILHNANRYGIGEGNGLIHVD